MRRTARYSSGFTLIELMLVCSVLGVLALIAVPKFGNLVVRAGEATLKGNLGTLRSALVIFYADKEGEYPYDLYYDMAGADNLNNLGKYLPTVAGQPILGNFVIPRNKVDNTDGHYEEGFYRAADQRAVSMPETSDAVYPDDTSALVYFAPGNPMGNEGTVCINCTHHLSNGEAVSDCLPPGATSFTPPGPSGSPG